METAPEVYQDKPIQWVDKKTFIFSRFLASNIMHTFHDDIIPLYATISEFREPFTESLRKESSRKDDGRNFLLQENELDHNLLFLESAGKSVNKDLYGKLSNNPFLELQDYSQTEGLVCFKDAVMGLSKRFTWYQYGFTGTQGPIKEKDIDGTLVRQIASDLLKKLSSSTTSKESEEEDDDDDIIVIFSRKRNRLILNEQAVADALKREFQLPVHFVRMEDRDIAANIELVSRARIAVGMHGSMLIMSMFMPAGSILIELYPYAVPVENYTPFRTMARLPGMNIVYRAWSNRHAKNNVMHPDRPAGEGGIKHLDQATQNQITNTLTVPPHPCCSDPYWLFRIYQDTTVDINELVTLIKDEAMPERVALLEKLSPPTAKSSKGDLEIKPAPLEKPKCRMVESESSPTLLVTWNPPWNMGKAASRLLSNYEVWIHETYKGHLVKKNLFQFSCDPGTEYTVYVRALFRDDKGKGPYSEAQKCLCSK